MSNLARFSENDFLLYARFLKEEIGFCLKEDKVSLLEGRLQKRLQEKEISPVAYLKLVQSDPQEKSYFINVITTHKTDWFREDVHFDFIIDYVKKSKQSSYSFWSAACSTGEEPYTLAIHLREIGMLPTNFKILGTDVSDNCIATCIKGVYGKDSVETNVNSLLVKKYFLQGKSENLAKYLKVDHHLSQNIKFKTFNLVSGQLYSHIKFDVILLRNVMIYFDHQTINLVISNLLRYLRPEGYLIIGLSESIHSAKELHLTRVSNSVYKYERF